ncbi:type I 3-dehydroquinate dehydratase [Pseudomonas entomophila]|uniref:type I 3-dehydroquinate dehydratase n=1 Tax=Pseudomonas entomophila TaxID=312306 RepID=UPI0015E30E5A|nr:type I 3-dehydroquinate dehydratase [Pseudomonas entomophila]MBA1192245.1 type I 3-dehydroquinate dehydratase [Pseudomonas entomophila]
MQRREFLITSIVTTAGMALARGAWAKQGHERRFEHLPAHKGTGPVLRLGHLDIGAGAPKVIASITGQALDAIRQQARAIAASEAVDIAELRLDHWPNTLSLSDTVAWVEQVVSDLHGLPLLATFRSAQEGGERALPDDDYVRLCYALLEHTAIDLLDVEMMKPRPSVQAMIAKAHQQGVAVILSNHDFQATPSHPVIVERLLRQEALGADILKIAVMPKTPEDVLTLMAASQEAYRRARRPLLTMSMGPLGVTSRLAGQLTGAALTYASVGQGSAPGQLEAGAVREVLGIIQRGAQG